jgi:hypothetical protein
MTILPSHSGVPHHPMPLTFACLDCIGFEVISRASDEVFGAAKAMLALRGHRWYRQRI